MAETKAAATDSNDKVLAAVSSIPIVGLIIYFAMKDASPFVKNFAKQGGTLFFAQILVMVMMVIPFVGWLLGMVANLGVLIGWIMLLINALQENKTYRLPLVADLADKIFK